MKDGIETLLFPTLIFAAIWILNVKSGPTVIKFQMSLITLQNSPASTFTNSLWTFSAGIRDLRRKCLSSVLKWKMQHKTAVC